MNKHKGGYIERYYPGDVDKVSSSSLCLDPCFVDKEAIGMRQLFDPESNTYTYLLWDKETEDAILIDPVDTHVERDMKVATTLNLVFGVNTHCHADHITGTGKLRKKLNKGGSRKFRSVISAASDARADEYIYDGDEIHFGNRFITCLATPGHTNGCFSFLTDDRKAVLTGDTLFVLGCGRTDFQGGTSSELYDSVHKKLFALPDNCILFPGHDYHNHTHSTIGNEKANNPRLCLGTTKEEFIEIMDELNLAKPQKICIAVPANLKDGTNPFFVRSLRNRLKQRWGIFG